MDTAIVQGPLEGMDGWKVGRLEDDHFAKKRDFCFFFAYFFLFAKFVKS